MPMADIRVGRLDNAWSDFTEMCNCYRFDNYGVYLYIMRNSKSTPYTKKPKLPGVNKKFIEISITISGMECKFSIHNFV